jgi:hypothetical protein
MERSLLCPSRHKLGERTNDMKRATKKTPSKASHKKAVKDLDVKPAKGRTVRGGITVSKRTDTASVDLFLKT